MSQISLGNTFIYSLIPFGHYIYRLMYLKGSADHLWTFFPYGMVFPLSLVPMFMIYFGAIKQGKVENIFEVFNYTMLIPIIWRIIGQHVLMNKFFDDGVLGFTFLFFSTFLVVFCTNLFDRYNKCKKIDSNKTLLTFIDTLNLFFYMNFISIMMTLGAEDDEDTNIRNSIMGTILFIIGYIYYQSVFNLANANDPETYCNPSITSNGNIVKFVLWGVYALLLTQVL
jgi:hypothetical protein